MRMRPTIVLAIVWTIFAARFASGEVTEWSDIVTGWYGDGENERTVKLELPRQLVRGAALPSFSVRGRDGETRINARHLERMIGAEIRRVAIIFFATWCVPCAQGAVRLKNSSDELERNGVLPVFINIGESDVAAINGWVDQYAGSGFARLIDARSAMAERFGLLESNGKMITPKTLVLDRNLRPLFLLGEEGSDYPEVLWK